MKSDAPPGGMPGHDESQRTRRFPLALFVVAELLCTGALIAWLVL
jgi:hypothetical protein